MRYGFGIDVGGTTIKLAFLDENGTMKDKWEIPTRTEEGGKNVLPDIAASVKEYMDKENLTNEQIIGIGIGVPGPVSDAGIVNKCVNLGWGITDLHGDLSVLTGLHVKGGNDANVAALGECWKGGGQGAKDMVMATLGTGVGGGIVINGRVIAGFHGAGGGHGTGNADADADDLIVGEIFLLHVLLDGSGDVGQDVLAALLGPGGDLPLVDHGAVLVEKCELDGGTAHINAKAVAHSMFPP